ncbi:glycosyltransferase [Myxococcus sp. XM-1-1-1]|uniref:glycosyltransferase n=1 Tax=Myxococcus sp. XM-1-1-1 TaxID=2874602 RepID=UPI001CBEE792|nr:glycosyltransferase [Myxococcus sp. XM-1-1-1]
MRICLVSRELSPFFGGGIGTYASLMCRAFAEAGHEMHVLTAPHAGLEHAGTLLPGVHVHTVAQDLAPGYAGAFPFPPLRHSMKVYLALRELHERHAFDFIEFPEYEGEGYFALRARRTLGHFASAVLAVKLHTPTFDVQQLNRVTTLDMDAAQQEYLEDTCIREADLLLSPTRSLLDRVSARLKLETRGVVVPYPFTAHDFPRLPPRPPLGRQRVLYFGRLEYRKGVHLLIEAMQSLFERGVDAELQLIGGDTQTGPFGRSVRTWLERRVAPAWKDRIRFEPPRSRPEVAAALAEATVCCFPSLWENFPNVCLEAMASGALVVGSDAGGMAELIEDGHSGLLFRSGDVDHLAATLEKALTTPALRETAHREAPLRIAEVCAPASVVRQVEAAVEGAAHARNRVLPKLAQDKSDTPRVSILVPYYNMGRYLPETLRAIRAQTFTDYEIVLVDDGSTDEESIELLDRVQAPDLRIIRKQNGGLSSARNAGLKVARGHYVLPLDPDDLIAPSFLEKAVTVMEATSGLGYVTSLVTYFVDDATQVTGGWAPWGMERDALWVANVASTCTALMRRRDVEDVGGYDEWLTGYEDWDVFCSLAERGLGGSVIPEPLFQYRLRPDSMTRTSLVGDRYRLMAYLYQKHPSLALHPERSLRILQGEAHKQEALLHARLADAAPRPLLDKVVDRVNGTLKRFDVVHHALRGVATRVVGTEDTSRPLRQQLVDRLRGNKPRR